MNVRKTTSSNMDRHLGNELVPYLCASHCPNNCWSPGWNSYRHCSCYSCSCLASYSCSYSLGNAVRMTWPSICHGLRLIERSMADCFPRESRCLVRIWPLVPPHVCWIWWDERNFLCNFDYDFVFILGILYEIYLDACFLSTQRRRYATKESDVKKSHLTKATPRGFPDSLSLSIFFCTINPYLPKMDSNRSSVTVRGRLVTYRFVSLISSPEGLAYETYIEIDWRDIMSLIYSLMSIRSDHTS